MATDLIIRDEPSRPAYLLVSEEDPNEVEGPRRKVEMAKSGKSACTGCKKYISANTPRFATRTIINGHVGWSYKHLECVTERQMQNMIKNYDGTRSGGLGYQRVTDLFGYAGLPPEAKIKVQQMWRRLAGPESAFLAPVGDSSSDIFEGNENIPPNLPARVSTKPISKKRKSKAESKMEEGGAQLEHHKVESRPSKKGRKKTEKTTRAIVKVKAESEQVVILEPSSFGRTRRAPVKYE